MERPGHIIFIVVVLLALVLVLAVALTRPAAAFAWQRDLVPGAATAQRFDVTLPGPIVAVVIDVQSGRQLAERWCSGCHLVEAQSRADQTPSFEMIARDPLKTTEWLRAWLMTPHSTMPDLALSRSEVEAIIVYLKSLDDG